MRPPSLRTLAITLCPFAFFVCSTLRAQMAKTPEPPRVVMVSIDGLRPITYTHPDALGLRVPNLRRLAKTGAFAAGVVGVLPTVTYPSHTTLITGVTPRLHGIAANTFFDPEGISNEAWRWYASEIRVPTLVTAARAAGLSTGAVSWPVSVGMAADFLVPEFWRTGSTHPSDLSLLRALSTLGVFEAAESFRGRPIGAPFDDAARTDLAISILRNGRPRLLLLHLIEVDHFSHDDGPDSAAAKAAIERADGELGRLVGAIEESGLAGSTLVAVVSDHGFMEVKRSAKPNTLLVEHGLATLDAHGNARTWKAWFEIAGGSAALYLADPHDDATRKAVRELLATKMREPDSGIREIIDGARKEALGGDDAAELFLDAADGWSFSAAATGPWSEPSAHEGYHGYAPDRPALHASLVLAGPGLTARGDLGVVPMVRIAPTLAKVLGIELSPRAAKPLPVF